MLEYKTDEKEPVNMKKNSRAFIIQDNFWNLVDLYTYNPHIYM